jgi:hypothetical protein
MTEPIRLERKSVPLTKSEKANGVDFASISLARIIDCIRIGEKKELEEYLMTIPIEKLSAQKQLILLDAMLAKAEEVEDNDFVDFIFNHFDERMGGFTKLKMFCLYLMRSGLQDNILEFIARSITKHSFENTIFDLNSGEASPELYEACLNAEKIFGEMPLQTLLKLKIYLCMDPLAKNYFLDKYVSEKLGNIEVVKAPEWIVNQTGEIVNQDELDIPDFPAVKLRSPGKFAEKYISKAKKENEDVPSLVDKIEDPFTYRLIATQYGLMPLEEKVAMLNRLIRITHEGKPIKLKEESADKDSILFMIYGPTNTMYDQVIKRVDSDSPCLKYGGCRMFLCLCSETEEDYYEEDIIERDDWFKGRCDICNRVIPKKHYALRKPLALGGWKGCFCSFACLNDSVTDTSDLLTPILLSIMTEIIMKVKILERNYKDSSQTIV